MASISDSQSVDPGSTPGAGKQMVTFFAFFPFEISQMVFFLFLLQISLTGTSGGDSKTQRRPQIRQRRKVQVQWLTRHS